MNSPVTREIEAKLVVANATVARRLEAAAEVAGLPLEPAAIEECHDAYYDTGSFGLTRRGGPQGTPRHPAPPAPGDPEGPAYRPEAVHQRPEIEAAAPDAAMAGTVGDALWPGGWPPAVVEAVVGMCGGKAPLGVVCRINQHRAVRRVLLPDGAPLGEMSIDRVGVDVGAGDGPAPRAAFTLLELELDPRRRDPVDVERLGELAADIASAHALDAATCSKYASGLRVLAAHPPGTGGRSPCIAAHTPAAEALRAMLWRCLIHMVLNEAETRRGDDIEAVHDMRVAIRRGRTGIRTFGRFFKTKHLRPIARGLRRTARALGPVRDMDVALDNLSRHPGPDGQEAGALEIGPGPAVPHGLRSAWLRQRAEARSELLAWLDSARYEACIASLRNLASSPGLGGKRPRPSRGGTPIQWQVRHAFPPAIVAAYEALRSHETVVDPLSGNWADLHALRIECKRLRYLLEPVDHLLGPEAPQLLKPLKRLQNTLGEMNDAVVAARAVRGMSAAGLGQTVLPQYEAIQAEVLASSRAPLATRWNAILAPEYRRTLFRAVARM